MDKKEMLGYFLCGAYLLLTVLMAFSEWRA